MKKIILLALTALIMAGCIEKDSNGHITINTGNVNNPKIEIIDSCEYVHWGHGLAHKGDCRFCKERRQKELEELVIKCKTPLEITHKDGVATDTIVIFKYKEK